MCRILARIQSDIYKSKSVIPRRLWISILIILIIGAFAGLLDLPINEQDNRAFGIKLPDNGFVRWLARQKINLGLDLRGGTQLVYDIDLSDVPRADRDSIVEGIVGVIERRVNALGVSEPNIYHTQVEDQRHIIVELAGIHDVDEAARVVGKTVLLEFKEEKKSFTEDEINEIRAFNKKAKESAESLLKQATKDPDKFGAIAKEYSEDLDSKRKGGDIGWSAQADIDSISGAIWKLKDGQVLREVVEEDNGFSLYRLVEKKEVNKPQWRARHILFKVESDKDEAKAKEKAEEVLAKAKAGEDFVVLANKYSQDPGSGGTKGGDLGFFGEGTMVKAFEEAVSKLEIGKISDLVRTSFGYHIIKLEEKRDNELQARLARVFLKKQSETPSGFTGTGLTGAQFKRADVTFTQTGVPQIDIQFDSDGAKLFADITKRNLKKPVAIYLDGEIISAPIVQTEITEGRAVITGKFTLVGANKLAQDLNTGAIPAPIVLIGQQKIGASLGRESLDISLRAGLWGLLIVALFMLFYYRLPGFLADIALGIYALVVLAIFNVFDVVLTLSGVAGFILSVGMAVDANILIFERMKEELGLGKGLHSAIHAGFDRAWKSIRDSNFSSLITCAILFLFGSGIIRGFALTLAIGILISMFSAIFVTRRFLLFASSTKLGNYLGIFLPFGKKPETIKGTDANAGAAGKTN